MTFHANWHEMSKSVFWETRTKNMNLSAEPAKRGVKVKFDLGLQYLFSIFVWTRANTADPNSFSLWLLECNQFTFLAHGLWFCNLIWVYCVYSGYNISVWQATADPDDEFRLNNTSIQEGHLHLCRP